MESLPLGDAFDVQLLDAVIFLNADQRHPFGKDGVNAVDMGRRMAGGKRQTSGIPAARFFKKLSRTRFNRTFAFFHAGTPLFQGSVADGVAVEADEDKMVLFAENDDSACATSSPDLQLKASTPTNNRAQARLDDTVALILSGALYELCPQQGHSLAALSQTLKNRFIANWSNRACATPAPPSATEVPPEASKVRTRP